MSAVTAGKLLTAEEFAKLPNPIDGSKQQLVRGEIVAMPPHGLKHGKVQVRVCFALETYNRAVNFGHLATETGVITEEGPDTVRGPDVSFWSYSRLSADQDPTGYPEVAPHLCVEVLSPGNTKPKMARKISEYFASGVLMVWVVDPEERTATIYRGAGNGRVLGNNDTITGDDVLPNFAWPVADFFPQSSVR